VLKRFQCAAALRACGGTTALWQFPGLPPNGPLMVDRTGYGVTCSCDVVALQRQGIRPNLAFSTWSILNVFMYGTPTATQASGIFTIFFEFKSLVSCVTTV